MSPRPTETDRLTRNAHSTWKEAVLCYIIRTLILTVAAAISLKSGDPSTSTEPGFPGTQGLAVNIELLFVGKTFSTLPAIIPNVYLCEIIISSTAGSPVYKSDFSDLQMDGHLVELCTASVLYFRFRTLSRDAGQQSQAMLTSFILFTLLLFFYI